ncbi:MAG TPA: F0F1 ATP synthase subunit delta [Xanthobacteraceae bacterium]|nr:F0F1 ATP synthase subunit delta [Xanthobacteraceae bacterium]
MVADEPIAAGMAGRYATALLELALEEKALDEVAADLEAFAKLLEENKELERLVKSPLFTADEQVKALKAILDKGKIKGIAANFLLTVAQNRRLFAVAAMIKMFRVMVAHQRGESQAEVTVAEPLADKYLKELAAALKSATKREVKLDVRVDPAILGGIKVKLGSRMIDASLKTKLNAIKLAMKEAR